MKSVALGVTLCYIISVPSGLQQKGDRIMMKTKKNLFEELTPIEWAFMFREEVVAKRLTNWTKKGLETMKDLWHKHYTTSAHRLICACILEYKEKDIDWERFEIALKEAL